MSTLVWPVATYWNENWALNKGFQNHIQGFEMAGYRKILRVSWTQRKSKQTNESILKEMDNELHLIPSIKTRKCKYRYYGHTMRREGNNLEKDIMVGAVPGTKDKG